VGPVLQKPAHLRNAYSAFFFGMRPIR
jgi:hypothetical protein